MDIPLCRIMQTTMTKLSKAGIPVPYERICSDILISDATNYYACTQKVGKNEFQITFSQEAFLVYGSDMNAYKNIMAHELIHCCPRCWNHGKKFKEYAMLLNEEYGFHIDPKPYSAKINYDENGDRLY